jgi:hypothetical protein
MKRTLVESVILVILIYCLVLIVAGEHFFGLSIKRELDPIPLASLAVTVFIVFFIQYFFSTRTGELRAEKDFLIANQNEAMKTARKCCEVIEAAFDSGKITKASREKIVLSLRELANTMDIFEEALRSSHCREMSEHFNKTKLMYYRFKSTATGGSFPASPYTMRAIVAIKREYRLLQREIQEWFFRVNGFH